MKSDQISFFQGLNKSASVVGKEKIHNDNDFSIEIVTRGYVELSIV